MITLPIYYTQEFKTKKNKTHLVADNFMRNAHFYLKNAVKQHYHTLVEEQRASIPTIEGQFILTLNIYYKNPTTDASNVAHVMEKFVLDALQELNCIQQDNVKYHLATTWNVAGQDKSNPRCEVEILPLSKS